MCLFTVELESVSNDNVEVIDAKKKLLSKRLGIGKRGVGLNVAFLHNFPLRNSPRDHCPVGKRRFSARAETQTYLDCF